MAVTNTRPLSKKQGETMGQILAFFEQHGRMPTYRELRNIFGLRSVSTIHQRVQDLRDKGFLRWGARHIALPEGAMPPRPAAPAGEVDADGAQEAPPLSAASVLPRVRRKRKRRKRKAAATPKEEVTDVSTGGDTAPGTGNGQAGQDPASAA